VQANPRTGIVYRRTVHAGERSHAEPENP